MICLNRMFRPGGVSPLPQYLIDPRIIKCIAVTLWLLLLLHYLRASAVAFSAASLPALQKALMEPPRPLRRDSTAVKTARISWELSNIRAILTEYRSHRVVKPLIAAAGLAHMLLRSRELLQTLLIDTASKANRAVVGS